MTTIFWLLLCFCIGFALSAYLRGARGWAFWPTMAACSVLGLVLGILKAVFE